MAGLKTIEINGQMYESREDIVAGVLKLVTEGTLAHIGESPESTDALQRAVKDLTQKNANLKDQMAGMVPKKKKR